MVPNDSPNVPAPPPGLSKEQIETVRNAHHYVTTDAVMVPMPIYKDLLAAYEVMSARLAWLAATYAEQAADWKGLMDQ